MDHACIKEIHQHGLKTDVIERKLKEKLGKNTDIQFVLKTGNNGMVRIGVMIRESHADLTSIIYLDEMILEVMAEKKNIDEMIDDVVQVYLDSRNHEKDFHDILNIDPEYILKNVRCHLVNREMNRQLLMQCPNTEYLDLAVIYRVPMRKSGEIMGTILVDEQMRRFFQIEKEYLEACAWRNTEQAGFVAEPLSSGDTEGDVLYRVANPESYQGASVMLFPAFMREIASRLGDDLYIFPSSIHAVLIAPVERMEQDVGFLKDIVAEINHSSVPKEDVLSDSVYCYSRSMDIVEKIA